ncbi:hypothetical protein KAR91_30840 [Candidatus Pacearchaeota archaeon]|nr:hypothetical protein [Candidatus Pacearchaeota archaeon]
MKPKSRVKLQLSKGRNCVNCNTNDGTTVPHHYKGCYQNDFWEKSKVYDIFTSDLCFDCHTGRNGIHNGYFNILKEEKSRLQMLWILKTMKNDYDLGFMVYDGFPFVIEKFIKTKTFKNIDAIRVLFVLILEDWKAGEIKYFKKSQRRCK